MWNPQPDHQSDAHPTEPPRLGFEGLMFMSVSILFQFCQDYERGIIKSSYLEISGPSCSKLTTWLVNDSLKFTSSDTQRC